jgi:multidrug resistance protein, MATE family
MPNNYSQATECPTIGVVTETPQETAADSIDAVVGDTPPLRPRRPIFELWSIAWPTVLTMTSYSVMQFIDRLMVGQVGPTEVAAQGNGGIWSFAPIAYAMGALTVVNTFVSQHLGAGRPDAGPRYAWSAVWLSIIIWFAFFLPYAILMPHIFGLMGHSPDLVRLESHYAQIMLMGALPLMISRGLHHYFFGLHRPKVVTVAAILGNTTNVIGNYVLIFGAEGLPHLGLPGVPGVPALGLYGAALGTIIGILVELSVPAIVFLGRKMNAELNTRSTWRPRIAPMKDLVRIGWPASVQFGNELTCWAIFMAVLVGSFGEDHITAAWITFGYMQLGFMPAIGFSVAITSVVGRYIGAGEPDTAVHRARLGVRMAMVYMTVCAATFLLFRHDLVGIFVASDLDAEHAARLIDIGGKLMICIAFFQTVDAFGLVYTGALRGAGDTLWPGVVTIVLSWSLIIGGGTFMVTVFSNLESVGPWIAAAAYIIVYAIAMSWRFESGKWRSIRLVHREPNDAAPVMPSAMTGAADTDPPAAPSVPGPSPSAPAPRLPRR